MSSVVACSLGGIGVFAGLDLSLSLLFVFNLTRPLISAIGSHMLKSRLTPHQQSSWQTAAHYQLLHATIMFVAAHNQMKTPALLFGTGILLFSGSIYGLCLLSPQSSLRKVLGPLTPLGGLALMAGWLLLGTFYFMLLTTLIPFIGRSSLRRFPR